MIKNNLVILAPVYEDLKSVSKLLGKINSLSLNPFILLVDDGSITDNISSRILAENNLSGSVIKLRRNVGHQLAIAIGLEYLSEKIEKNTKVIVMDSDGEDSPESIPQLLDFGQNADIVVAKRGSRHETKLFKFLYIIYRFIFRIFSGRKINFGNFVLLSHSAVTKLVNMKELRLHFAGSILLSRIPFEEALIDRGKRYFGKSKLNLTSLILHGFRALMVFSEDVLVRVGVLCIIIATMSIMGGISAVLLKFIGYATPGWFSIAVGILSLVFIQTATLTLTILMLTGVMKNTLNNNGSSLEMIKEVNSMK